MHLLNWKYANDYNQRRKRKGHLWWDRYKNIPVQSNAYALSLMRYINRNPIRANMVRRPGDWRWSGFHALGRGLPDRLITFHPVYLSLGATAEERQINYSAVVEEESIESEQNLKSKFSEAEFIGSDIFGKAMAKKQSKCE